jgi:hypothetical protein
MVDSASQPDEPEALGLSKAGFVDLAMQDAKLLSQKGIFGNELGFAAWQIGGDGESERMPRGFRKLEDNSFQNGKETLEPGEQF